MTQTINEIEVNGIKYIPKDSTLPLEPNKAVIVRTVNAGVFFGYRTSQMDALEKGIVVLTNARRIWFWSGAASLSQLAVEGTSKPKECKFPIAVPIIELTNVIEVIPCTTKAVESINNVPVWTA